MAEEEGYGARTNAELHPLLFEQMDTVVKINQGPTRWGGRVQRISETCGVFRNCF